MNWRPDLLGAIWAVTFCLVLGGCIVPESAARRDAGMQYGGPSDTDFSAALWSAAQTAQLVGPRALQSRSFSGTGAHSLSLQRIDGLLKVAGQVKPVIVLNNFSRSVAGDLQSIDVMFRRVGYASDSGDWFWASYEPDGTLKRDRHRIGLAGKIAGDSSCIACHTAAPGADWVFAHNRYR